MEFRMFLSSPGSVCAAAHYCAAAGFASKASKGFLSFSAQLASTVAMRLTNIVPSFSSIYLLAPLCSTHYTTLHYTILRTNLGVATGC